MEPHQYGDETLMAYADGELDPDAAGAVEAAARTDPALAARIAMFARTREVLGAAARARPPEPLSPALEARVRETLAAAAPPSDRVVAFRPRTRPASSFRPMAAAAAIALAVGLAGGFVVSQSAGDRDPGGLRVAALEEPGLARALDSLPSGQRVEVGGGEVATIASFLNADGELCREFEYDSVSGQAVISVACRTADGWEPRLAIVAAGADDTGYAPASSLDTLDAYLGAIGAGPPLSPEEEASALARLTE